MSSSEPSVIITDAEKQAAIRKMETQLREWRLRNPDAPKGR